MFDIGWSELLLIAVIAIVVVGPRDLPRLMRTVGQYTSKLKSMSRELKTQFDQAVREAELDDVRKSLTDLKTPDPVRQIRESVSKPMEELKSAVSDAGRIEPAEKADSPAAPAGQQSTEAAPRLEQAEPAAPADDAGQSKPVSKPEPETKQAASGP